MTLATQPFGPMDAVLVAALLVAVYTDLRWQWLPNALTFPMMAAGLVWHAATGTFFDGLLGLLFATALHVGLFVLGVQKAGDSKLMMGLGAFIGWQEVGETTFWKYVVFVPIGLAVLAARGKLGNLVAAARWTWQKAQGFPVGERPAPTEMAYAPAIALGWVIARLTDLAVFHG